MAGVCEPFVGVFDGSGGISLPAGDLGGTPSDPTVIGMCGQWKAVATFDEFAALDGVTEAAGVWTYDTNIIWCGDIRVPTGDRLAAGENSFLISLLWPQGVVRGDVDGPLISGPINIADLSVVNESVGPNAWCIEINSFLGRTCILNRSSHTGIRGLRVSNLFASALIGFSGASGPPIIIGIELANIIGGFVISRWTTDVSAPGSLGISIASSTIIAVGFTVLQLVVTLALSTEWAVAISDAMILAPGGILHFTGCSITGPQDRFFRQDPGDMPTSDVRLVTVGNPSVSNWGAVAVVARLDVSNPVLVVLPAAPSDAVPVPYGTGAGIEVEATLLTRFTLFKDPGDTSRWWVRYSGPLPQRGSVPNWEFSLTNGGGAEREFTACVEINPALRIASVQQDDGGAFTDYTSAAQDEAIDDVPLTPDPFAIGDATYYGADDPFETLEFLVSQAGVGTFTIVWEYWDGGAWVVVVGLLDGTSGFTAAAGYHDVDHEPQLDWAAVAVDGIVKFYIRSRLTVATTLTTQPRATQIRSYAGFEVIPSTVAPLVATAARQLVTKSGVRSIDIGDRFRPAMQNEAPGHTVFVQSISQTILVAQ